jgi:hypothetical protein
MAPHKTASAAIDGNFWLVAVARDCGSEHTPFSAASEILISAFETTTVVIRDWVLL